MQKLFRSLIAVGGLAGLVACGDDVTVTEPTPPFAISGAPVTAIQVGATVQLQATEAATWQTSNASVATVDGSGLVTAVGAGTASITATSTADVDRKASVTITVTAPAVRNVTVAPTNAILRPGETLGLVANVDADPGVARTVTWASSNNAVATVTAAGVVTAVTPGAVTITATSTANTAVSGAASITVRPPIPATISVSNITITGTNGVTANVNNITGSIDVNLNVDPGEQVVQSVDVLIDGQVACSQNLSSAQSESMRIAAAFENIEDVIVSCQINTADFDAATGVADFFNGQHTLSARANLQGGTQVATPSTQLTFNNQSGVIAVITNDNGADAELSINPGTGLAWIGGSVTLDFTGVSYVPNTTLASVTCTIFGKTKVFVLTNGKATATWTDASTWSSTDNDVGGYLSPAPESIACPSALLSNGQPLTVAAGTTPLLNFGAPGMNNAAMPALQVLQLDNSSPGVASANGVAQAPIVIGAMVTPWVNANSTLGPSASSVNVLGLPSLATLNATTAGPGNDIEEGVDAITVTVYVPAAGGTLSGSAVNCSLTGLTAVTTGNQLTETTVSTAYPARIVVTDALGNRTCMDLAATFGADFTAPTASVTAGPAANTGYSASPLPAWSVTASDNASGFTLTPLRVSVSRLNINNTTTCVSGGSGCPVTSQQQLSFDPTLGTNVDGYYTTTINIVDQAGNSTSLVTGQVNGLDVVAPTFSGGISLPPVIAGAMTNTFTTTVADNLDLGSIFGVVAYPVGSNIQYQTQTIGAFGAPLEQSSANLAYAAADWIRCLNAAGSFAAAAGPPTGITLSVTDQTSVPATNTTSLASAAFGANAQACSGSVGNIAATDINSFTVNLPVYPGTKTQVDLDGVSLATASATTVTLSAVADVALNSSADPFTRVDFYYVNTAGNLVKIGTAAPQLAQTQTNRTYTYSLVWDPAAPVQTGAVTIVAIGVDAQGDGVFGTGGPAVTIVP
ncbi:MAG TPA: Ig-like domain-containing protein [Gemmatimonadaceae bacterium]